MPRSYIVQKRTKIDSRSIGARTSMAKGAILEVAGVDGGFLPPRLTTTEITALVTALTANSGVITPGLTVYDRTLNKLKVWTGSAFETVTSA